MMSFFLTAFIKLFARRLLGVLLRQNGNRNLLRLNKRSFLTGIGDADADGGVVGDTLLYPTTRCGSAQWRKDVCECLRPTLWFGLMPGPSTWFGWMPGPSTWFGWMHGPFPWFWWMPGPSNYLDGCLDRFHGVDGCRGLFFDLDDCLGKLLDLNWCQENPWRWKISYVISHFDWILKTVFKLDI